MILGQGKDFNHPAHALIIPEKRCRSNNRGTLAVAKHQRAETGLRVRHFADLRFLPMAPRFCTFRMESGAKGTRHEMLKRASFLRLRPDRPSGSCY